MSVADKVEAKLREIAAKMEGTVKVGFLENATYPDGTPVAAVAFWNEFGSVHRSEDEGGVFTLNVTPARPFFRTMIDAEKPAWGGKVARLAKATHNDASKILALMGEDIKGALVRSINDFSTPGNAESTIKAKGFDKPLIRDGIMVNAVDYEVEDGS
jgi:hypothetical protein